MDRTAWRVALAATTLTALGSGLRASGGLFVSPLNTASGPVVRAVAAPPDRALGRPA